MNKQQLIIFILEILYYTNFLYLCRKKDKYYKLFIIFLLSNIGMYFIGFSSFYAYTLYFVEVIVLSLLLNVQFLLYDMLVMIVSLLFKLFIELCFFIILQKNISLFVCVLVMGITKNIVLVLIKDKLNKFYLKFKKMWNNNNFYIRYSFSTLLYLYIIASAIYIILMI